MSVTKDNLFTKIAVVIFIVIVKCVCLFVGQSPHQCNQMLQGHKCLELLYRVKSLLTRSFIELTWTA